MFEYIGDYTIQTSLKSDLQIGEYIGVDYCEISINGIRLPVQWSKLKRVNPAIYEAIRKHMADKGRPISDWA
jgi:hypothetical protein